MRLSPLLTGAEIEPLRLVELGSWHSLKNLHFAGSCIAHF